MLMTVCENYNALRNQVIGIMSKNAEREISPSSKKRKSESSADDSGNEIVVNKASESSSTDDDALCKKPREETIKAKITRVYYRTQASDTSLVSQKMLSYSLVRELSSSSSSFCSLSYLVCLADCEGWTPVEKVWTKDHQGQPLSQSLLQMRSRSKLPCQEEGQPRTFPLCSFWEISYYDRTTIC